MKILHSESSLGWGGQEHRILKEMRALRARGHALHLLTRPNARLTKRAREEGFPVKEIAAKNAWDITAIYNTYHYLKQEKFDVLNTHSGHDSIWAATAARLARTPLIVRTRHLALPITSLFSYRYLAHRVITVSHYVEKQLIQKGLPASHVQTIYTAIEAPQPVQHSSLREELHLKESDILVATVAILRYEKGHQDLIDAAEPLLKKYPLHLIFAGDGPIFEELKNHIRHRGLTHCIHLLGLRTDIANILSACNFFCLPTHSEALGTAFIEAMHAGLATIGTDIDGVPEAVIHNQTGILFPLKDIAALRAALEKLIENPTLCKKMGENGRQLAASRFGLETMAAQTENFYLENLKCTT